MDKLKLNSAQSIILVGDIDSDKIMADFKISAQDFLEIADDYSIAHIKELLHFINLKPSIGISIQYKLLQF